ncbi:MAG: NTP transferase domain-containing protein, partial [Bradymonadaceae bacterium]
MKAIIIAAGMGSRLEHHTDDKPKCMVEIAGRSILSHQLEALAAHGVDDIHIIRGYLAEKLVVPGATYWANDDFENNNILFSLFCAEEAIDGPFLSTYSDIVYTADVVKAVTESRFDITLVVDRCWADAYEGRDDHPPEQAELCEVDGDRVVRVGKSVGPEKALGEFIGLAGYSARGAEHLKATFGVARASYGDDEPFQQAKLFRKAYLTDLFMEMIDRGMHVGFVTIDGGWREIDTV